MNGPRLVKIFGLSTALVATEYTLYQRLQKSSSEEIVEEKVSSVPARTLASASEQEISVNSPAPIVRKNSEAPAPTSWPEHNPSESGPARSIASTSAETQQKSNVDSALSSTVENSDGNSSNARPVFKDPRVAGKIENSIRGGPENNAKPLLPKTTTKGVALPLASASVTIFGQKSGPSNTAPAFSALANVEFEIGRYQASYAFTVDESSSVATIEDSQALTVTATSSNQALIADANITVSYTDNGTNDSAALSPFVLFKITNGAYGVATITLTATDDGIPAMSGSTTFVVTVTNPFSSLYSDISVWFKSDGGVFADTAGTIPISGGAAVKLWKDQSSNGLNVEESGVAGQNPTYTLDGGSTFNNLPVINFDGGDLLRNNATNPIAAASGRTIIAVGKVAAASAVGGPIITFRRSAFIHGISLFQDSGNMYYFSDGVDAQKNLFETPAAAALTLVKSTFVLTVMHEGVGIQGDAFINGNRRDTSQFLGQGTDTGNVGFSIGTREDIGSQWWTGDIAEIITFKRALSTSERQMVEAKLAKKYKVSLVPQTNLKLHVVGSKGVKNNVCAGVNATNGDSVVCWEDQSGLTNNLTSTNNPLFELLGINSLEDLFFSNANMESASANFNFDRDSKFYGSAVFSPSSLQNSALMSKALDGATSKGWSFGLNSAGNLEFLMASDQSTSNMIQASGHSAMSLSSHYVGSFSYDGVGSGKNLSLSLNGTAQTLTLTHDALTASALAATNFRLGSVANLSRDFHGKISELTVHSTALSEMSRQSQDIYFAEKYGITYASHPILSTASLKTWYKADLGMTGTRQNILLNTEDMSLAVATSGCVVTLNNTVAPDGAMTADQCTETVDGGNTNHNFQFTLTLDGASRYVFSAYVKTSGSTRVLLEATSAGGEVTGNLAHAYFNLTINAVSSVGGSTLDSGITDMGNSWKRIWIKAPSSAAGNGVLSVQLSSNGADNGFYQGTGAGGMYVWGVQQERSEFITDYIANGGASTALSTGSGLNISSWANHVQGRKDLVSSSNEFQPQYVVNGGASFNQKPILRFSGSDVLVTAVDVDFQQFMLERDRTQIVVFKATALPGALGCLLCFAPRNNAYASSVRGGFVIDNLSNLKLGWYGTENAGAVQFNYVSTPIALNTTYLATSIHSSNVYTLYLNGTLSGTSGTTAHNDVGDNNTDRLYIGAPPATNSDYFTGDIAEVLIFSSALSADERKRVECHLSQKYGLGLTGC